MTRRALLSSVCDWGGLGASASYPCYFEPRWLQISRPNINLWPTALPNPIRLLQLSDLHLSTVVPLGMIEAAVTLGLREAPDLICVTGDFITHRIGSNRDAYVRTLRRLSSVALTFAVMGNHDGGIWAQAAGGYSDNRVVRQIIEESSIRLLHNSSTRLQIRGSALSLVGVGDLWSDEIDSKAAFDAVDPQDPIILLAHNPDSQDRLARHPWHLMLSGHTHGGQVILPFDGPRFAPVEDKRYVAGLGQWGDRQIHVSRGIGNVGGVRFRCRPEVNLLLMR
jgi:predicted MPP superfamily phosphohydrolase